MNAHCRDCEADQDHCHGTVIRHTLWRSECTEDGCTAPELIGHTYVMDCDAVGCACGQPMGSADVLAS
ncbi:hypothetical protein [Mycolicibacterium mengxianglii]|uniref:hypothetical protein n=1 Tax=Mycolicibacterium mengxianglii TaxID=2736649 RepID=UPI001E42BBE9|nr:hypothetical protein [Mycolicibacterium mengxianglii]